MRAVQVHQFGGGEVLRIEDIPTPKPGPGEMLVRVKAAGVNFIDIYQRTGLYPRPFPFGLGQDGAGVVEAIGPGVTAFAAGDRVAFMIPGASNAEYAIVPAERAAKIPDNIPEEVAAAGMLKGMTARYLLKSTFPVKAGQTIVFHAAAGGVGQIASQWAASLGVRVIGIVGSEAKAAVAKAAGCAEVIVSPDGKGFAEKVRTLTNGEGVPVVYDSVGKDTWEQSIDCLAPLGMLVLFGNASGPVPPINPLLLSQKGSLYLTRPTTVHYFRTGALFREAADDLFAAIKSGAVKVAQPRVYKLADVAQAHADLEGRKTTGSLVLAP